MDFLQTWIESSSFPLLTAFLLGLLTAISPCPLATNIAAIGYISKDVANQRRIFRIAAFIVFRNIQLRLNIFFHRQFRRQSSC